MRTLRPGPLVVGSDDMAFPGLQPWTPSSQLRTSDPGAARTVTIAAPAPARQRVDSPSCGQAIQSLVAADPADATAYPRERGRQPFPGEEITQSLCVETIIHNRGSARNSPPP